EKHEQGHVDLAREKLKDIGQSMIGQQKKAAEDGFKAALKDLQDASDAYDAKNDHGRNEGCEIVTEEAVEQKSAEESGKAEATGGENEAAGPESLGAAAQAAGTGEGEPVQRRM